MARLRYNGLVTTLGAPLTNSATSITFSAALTHSGGTAVPTVSGADYIPLTILTSTGGVSEIVYLTAYTSAGTSGTITRGREGTTGVSHASGDKVIHGPTSLDAPDPTTLLAGTQNFRGLWGPDSVAYSTNFATIPNAFIYSNDATATGGILSVAASSATGRTNPPFSPNALRLRRGAGDGYTSTYVSVNLASLGITGTVTRVTYKAAGVSESYEGFSVYARRRNGTETVMGSAAPFGWTAFDIPVVGTDTLSWRASNAVAGQSTNTDLFLSDFAVYAITSPYMIGQYVIHLDQLWRSTTDNNTTTPGSDPSWVQDVSFGNAVDVGDIAAADFLNTFETGLSNG